MRRGATVHSLEVIILRNEEAAGRELAHRVNDDATCATSVPVERSETARVTSETDARLFALLRAFFHGYNRGREEK